MDKHRESFPWSKPHPSFAMATALKAQMATSVLIQVQSGANSSDQSGWQHT